MKQETESIILAWLQSKYGGDDTTAPSNIVWGVVVLFNISFKDAESVVSKFIANKETK